MNQRQLPVWLRGGILGSVSCIIFGIVLLSFKNADFLFLFFPIPLVTLMGLGMRNTPSTFIVFLGSMGLSITLQVLIYFGIGAILGGLFQKTTNRFFKTVIILAPLILIIAIMSFIKIRERQWYNKTFYVGFTPSDCEKEDEKGLCYLNVFRHSPPSVEICNKTGDPIRSGCAKYVGEKTGNVDLCMQFIDNDAQDNCIAGTPTFLKTDEFCGGINKQEIKDDCFRNSGIASKMAAYCQKVKDGSKKSDCFLLVALEATTNCGKGKTHHSCISDVCLSLSDQNAARNCFLNVAARFQDVSYCDFISDSEDMQKCYFMVSEYPPPEEGHILRGVWSR